MDGVVFEDLLAVALERCGYGVELAGGSDGGPGLVASRGGRRWFVHARRQDRAVDCSAVDQAIHGGSAHRCGTVLVVTSFGLHARHDRVCAPARRDPLGPARPRRSPAGGRPHPDGSAGHARLPPLPPSHDLRAEAGLRLDLPQSLDRDPVRGDRPLSGAGDPRGGGQAADRRGPGAAGTLTGARGEREGADTRRHCAAWLSGPPPGASRPLASPREPRAARARAAALSIPRRARHPARAARACDARELRVCPQVRAASIARARGAGG